METLPKTPEKCPATKQREPLNLPYIYNEKRPRAVHTQPRTYIYICLAPETIRRRAKPPNESFCSSHALARTCEISEARRA